jgi:steroid delta-isomerase-like uncharacterized protein
MRKPYLTLALVLIFCVAVSCRDKETLKTLETIKTGAEVEVRNMQLAKRYIEAFNQKDFDALMKILSADYTVHNPSGSPEATSLEKFIENYKSAFDAFPEFTWSIEDIIAGGDKVVCRIIISGIYKGGLPGLPDEEKSFRFSMISILRIENGKIIKEWQEDDQLGLALQLGYELKLRETAK